MIRNFELFCKLKFIKLSELMLFNKSVMAFCTDTSSCPLCGAKGALESHGHYYRDLIYLKAGEITITRIAVPRFMCDCGHTHAILPACLIPYASYGLFFILSVLRVYFLRSKTILAICESFGISTSTLYAWIHLFHTHKALWLGALSDLESSATDFLPLLLGKEDFLQLFFIQMSFSFLQGMSFPTTSRRLDLLDDP